eukprot:jgi/Hompol1/109/HPOL_005225-RA
MHQQSQSSAASSLFPSFLSSQPSRKSGLSSYVFRSLSNNSSASLDSQDNTPSLVGNGNAHTNGHSATHAFVHDTNTNAEDEEDALLLAHLDKHKRRASEAQNKIQGVGSGAAAASLQQLQQQELMSTTKWLTSQLQSSFLSVKESVMGSQAAAAAAAAGSPSDSAGATTGEFGEIDWDFWGNVINDYEGTLRKHPREFTQKLHRGLPEPIRGMMWQLMANSKSESLEEEYIQLLARNTRHEKIIQRDLARTFPTHEHFKDATGPGQTSLFNVLKAYSIYDQEIGYCQGIAFIVGPLLLNMPEEQSFCVLVRLMFDYGFRDLFSPKMIGLQLRNYQFDKLVEEQFPAVFRHLVNQDIKSTMYASQWFMTLFAYRFPLDMVFRILDIVFAEGPEAVLRFALALIKHNADMIVTLDFEPLLDFLKNGLFDMYITNINRLITDASAIRVAKHKLDRWEKEFHELMRRQSPEVIEAEAVKAENRRILDLLRKLEHNYEQLNREHIDLANTHLKECAERQRCLEQIEDLGQQVASLKMVLADDRKHAEDAVRSEMMELALKNTELTRANAGLQDDVADLEAQLASVKVRLATSDADREELRRKLDHMRKALGIS